MKLLGKIRFSGFSLCFLAVVIIVVGGCGNESSERRLNGAGASFPAPVYRAWAIKFSESHKSDVSYRSVGSSRGIKLIKERKVDFGASDIPMTEKELNQAGLFQIPMLIGNVVPVVNLPGIKSGSLVLSGPLLAAIYLGEIDTWNDPALKQLNPDLELPERRIVVIHRADGSGTSYLFTGFLNQYAFRWRRQIGQHAQPPWPVGLGAEHNTGVMHAVTENSGSIGYVEFNYAKAGGLNCASLALSDGVVIQPSPQAFYAGARRLLNAKTIEKTGSYVPDFGVAGWPLTGITYIIMAKKAKDQKQARALLEFFTWCYDEGRDQAIRLDYLPLNRSLAETGVATLRRYLATFAN